MPELPEVQTTVDGLNRTVKGREIVDVWTDYQSSYKAHQNSIKVPAFFKIFKKKVVGAKIKKARRRAKNILLDLDNGETILTHMKMTGHYVYDHPNYPHVRLTFKLDNGKTLALSDMRRFAKVTILPTNEVENFFEKEKTGPEPLDPNFTYKIFESRLLSCPNGRVKQVLINPVVVAGIGNIYSDEILWRASVHPLSIVKKIPKKNLMEMYKATKILLARGIKFGGDSMSDYRNIEGERGHFQEHHEAYRRTGKPCSKKDKGIIKRQVIGSRSAHFCPAHQTLFR